MAAHVTSLMLDAELRMLPESGHLPWLDDPQEIAGAAAAFLAAGGGE